MYVNVLLVEDKPDDVKLFQDTIDEINKNFDKKVNLFQINNLDKDIYDYIDQNEISIVFIDLELKVEKVEEILKIYKKLNIDTPLVVYTGVNDISLGVDLLKLGADDYICKFDLSPSMIIKTILLNIQRKEQKNKLAEKERLLMVQSRSAVMGEMIGMIAHQWKQPLSVLAMVANNMKLDFELEKVKVEDFEIYSDDIAKQVEHLSQTIDDFRNFFKPVNEKENVSLIKTVNDAVSLIKKSLENNEIKLEVNFEDPGKVRIFPTELMQVLINIIKNAKDILQEREIKSKKISINIYKKSDLFIEIEDNGEGIPGDIIDKIFEPYFTTKEKMNGTGLGLYMSKMIIEEHFKGFITAENTSEGAKFIIRLRDV